jgi:hypothetical protein
MKNGAVLLMVGAIIQLYTLLSRKNSRPEKTFIIPSETPFSP